MNKQQIMSRKNRKLSNRMTGSSETIVMMNKEKNIAEGIFPQFIVSVENRSADTPVRVALIPAHFNISQIVEGKLAYNNASELVNAGYPVGAVLCEGAITDASKGMDVLMQAGDPTRSIRHFLDYLKLNPTYLKKLEVVSDDQNAFDTNLTLVENVNPFTREAERNIDLSTMYDLYQQARDRVRVDLEGNEIELSDTTLLMATIPAATKMKFIFRF